MIKISKTKSHFTVVKGVFKDSQIPKSVNKEEMEYTYFPSDEIGYIYLGKRNEFTIEKLKKAIMVIIKNNKKGLNIELKDFYNEKIKEEEIIKLFVETYEFETAVLWNKKTGDKKPKDPKDIIITDVNTDTGKQVFTESLILSESQTFARNLQTMAPNECNSETLAKMIESEFAEVENINSKVLKLDEIKKMNMGLLLAVNSASNYEPRVVILEYKGNPSSKEKTVMVGKGITFDAGGMNIKTGRHMLGMKYDMSGAAIVTGAMKAISSLSPKANISIVAPLTDNVISNTAGLPDSVWTSMNGKTVEINNTDAEGRLVMADSITYGIRNLGATKIIDISTLTGAVLVALGQTFTGVWTTKDSDWELINKTAKKQNELVWRMPFHKDFGKYINKSIVADLKNTDLTGLGGSSSAAMFLKEFTENIDYIHLDIAGTASDNNGKCFGPMVKTLAKLF